MSSDDTTTQDSNIDSKIVFANVSVGSIFTRPSTSTKSFNLLPNNSDHKKFDPSIFKNYRMVRSIFDTGESITNEIEEIPPSKPPSKPQYKTPTKAPSKTSIKYSDDMNVLTKHFYLTQKRRTWRHKVDFLFLSLSLFMGVPYLWRVLVFSLKFNNFYFMILYILSILLIQFPLCAMKSYLCQFCQRGYTQCWFYSYAFRGIGICYLILAVGSIFIFKVNSTWLILFMYNSFIIKQPYRSCGNEWNTDLCFTHLEDIQFQENKSFSLPQEEFFNFYILSNYTSDIQVPTFLPFNYEWYIIYFGLCFVNLPFYVLGYHLNYKFIHFSFLFTTSFFILLFVTACTLPHNWIGIKNYFMPNIDDFKNRNMWYSIVLLSATDAILVHSAISVLSSFNTFKHRTIRTIFIFYFVHWLSNCFIGLAYKQLEAHSIFKRNVTYEMFQKRLYNNQIIFVGFLYSLSEIWLPSIWTSFYFFSLIVLNLSCTNFTGEIINSSILDLFPKLRVKSRYMLTININLCCFYGFFGSIFFCRSGYIYYLCVDRILYGGSTVILYFVEVISLFVFYTSSNVQIDLNIVATKYKHFITDMTAYYKYCLPIYLIAIATILYVVPYPYYEYYFIVPKQVYIITIAFYLGILILIFIVLVCFVRRVISKRRSNSNCAWKKTWNEVFKESVQWGPGYEKYWKKNYKYNLKLKKLNTKL